MYERIHFEGRWSEPDIHLIAASIAKAEARIARSPSPSFGKTWICVREQVDAASVLYIATRFGFHTSLKAVSAPVLAEQIDEFGEFAYPYADSDEA